MLRGLLRCGMGEVFNSREHWYLLVIMLPPPDLRQIRRPDPGRSWVLPVAASLSILAMIALGVAWVIVG